MDLKLNGKTAFVSGSTQGIGFAIAQGLLKEGAHVIINGRSESKIEEAVQKLKESMPGANVSGIAADFSKVEEVNALLQQLPDIDILINNAGIFEPKAFTEISDDEWFRFFEVNVLSGVRLARHFFPKMIAKDWGQDHLHFQRIGREYPRGNDSLRHHQNRPARCEPGVGRTNQGYERYCEHRHARADPNPKAWPILSNSWGRPTICPRNRLKRTSLKVRGQLHCCNVLRR